MERPRAPRPVLAALAVALVLAACGTGSGGVVSGDAPAVPVLGTDADELDEAVVVVTSPDAEVRVDVKVAATDVDRRRGLMGVADLPPGAGMLFLFDEDRDGGFWMRDTLVPLDIAYIAADGAIGAILAMDPCEAAEASDCPVYTPDMPYRTALEVPQGWFDSVGIAVGDTVTWSEPVPPVPSTQRTGAGHGDVAAGDPRGAGAPAHRAVGGLPSPPGAARLAW